MKIIEICHHLFLDKSPTNNIFNIVSYKQVPKIMEISFFQHRMEISFFSTNGNYTKQVPNRLEPVRGVPSRWQAQQCWRVDFLDLPNNYITLTVWAIGVSPVNPSQHTGQWDITMGNNNLVYLRMG